MQEEKSTGISGDAGASQSKPRMITCSYAPCLLPLTAWLTRNEHDFTFNLSLPPAPDMIKASPSFDTKKIKSD